jgi:glycosyltransferase involved in cell wall biosynthesis
MKSFFKLSIIIPVYNEKETIEEVLARVKKAKIPGIKKEIIIIDDASTDGTGEILKKLKLENPDLKIFCHQKNQGKGGAIITGLNWATGNFVVIQDADLEYDPQDISRLLMPIIDGKAEVVYGSRFTGEHRNMLFWHMIGNKLLTFLVNIAYNTTLSDMEVCYKLFKKEILKDIVLKEKRFGFDPEITVKVLKRGYRIYEVPVSYCGREFDQGKKITWKDGFRVLWVLIKYRFLE